MKSTKIYSLDECLNESKVISKLNLLADDRKIDYEIVESDLIKIKDISLTAKEIKELNQFLYDNDVLEDNDIDCDDEDEEDDDLFGTEDY